jgi:hybrid cluster-associated redox disulfide protein
MRSGPAATLTVAELLDGHPGAAAAFAARGMACVGCAMARFETLAEVAAIYAVELDALLEDVTGSAAGLESGRRAAGRSPRLGRRATASTRDSRQRPWRK